MEKVKDLNYWKNNCEEDYLHTPISVLRYITELEKEVENKINFIDSSLQLKEKEAPTFEEWKLFNFDKNQNGTYNGKLDTTCFNEVTLLDRYQEFKDSI